MDNKAAICTPWSDTPNLHITKYTRKLTRSAAACVAIGVPCTDDKKLIILVENMYARAHFTEIELVAWENSSSQQQKWYNTVHSFTKLYGDRLAFQKREAGEKPFDSAACLK